MTTQQTRRPATFTHADRWRAALADCADTLTREGLSPATVARVVKHVTRFAADSDRAPYDVRPGDVLRWLDAQTCSAAARYAYGTSLRTFYRWAHRTGRVPLDPTATDGPHPCAKAIPTGWHDALAEYRRHKLAAQQAEQTRRLDTRILARLARETGAPDPWCLTASDLADWLARHPWGRETRRNARRVLRGFYGWAYDMGYTDPDPARHLPAVRSVPPNPRPASEDAYRDALHRAAPRVALMIRLAAELGLRRAEVASVHTADLDHDNGTGRVWLTVWGKGDKVRRLPLPPTLAAELRDLPPGYAFPGSIGAGTVQRGRTGQAGHLSAARVGELVSAALPHGVTMHQLRHRFATRAYGTSRDVLTVQRLLGHASPNTTQRYVQTSDAALLAAVDAVAGEHRHD